MASAAFCALLIAHISETDGKPASATWNNGGEDGPRRLDEDSPATPGWYAGAPGASCTATCRANGLVCRDAALMEHNGDVDTGEELYAMAISLGADPAHLPASGTCSGCLVGGVETGCSDTDVPVFEGPNGPRGCVFSDPNRGIETYYCYQIPIPLTKIRPCWCETSTWTPATSPPPPSTTYDYEDVDEDVPAPASEPVPISSILIFSFLGGIGLCAIAILSSVICGKKATFSQRAQRTGRNLRTLRPCHTRGSSFAGYLRGSSWQRSSAQAAVTAPVVAAGTELSAVPASDPMEALEKIGKLRDNGTLTEDEFQAKKSDLLARL